MHVFTPFPCGAGSAWADVRTFPNAFDVPRMSVAGDRIRGRTVAIGWASASRRACELQWAQWPLAICDWGFRRGECEDWRRRRDSRDSALTPHAMGETYVISCRRRKHSTHARRVQYELRPAREAQGEVRPGQPTCS